jgi:hypothetical protein
VWTSVQDWVRPEFRSAGIAATFSDDRLANTSNAFAEAVTLIWLGREPPEKDIAREPSWAAAI